VPANVAASFAGQGFTALLTLATVPVYLRVLGAEAYGLVGLFVSLVVLTGLFDLGVTPTMSRVMARDLALRGPAEELRDLARTLECVSWAVGLTLGLAVAVAAPWLARSWIQARALSPDTVEQAVRLMGAALAAQWPIGVYGGGLMGAQRQVAASVLNALGHTLRLGGAVVVLAVVSPTITAFFAWQAIASAAHAALLMIAFWRVVPPGARRPRPRWERLGPVWRFAAGLTGIMLVSTFVTQADKVILSRLLTLEAFGYYALATVAANGIHYLVRPFYAALAPAFAEHAAADGARLRELYHRACQWLSVVLLPPAVVLALFAPEIMTLWLGDAPAARHAPVLVRLLVIGNVLGALAYLPYALQLAHGWTRLALVSLLGLAAVLVPATVVATLRHGAVGAAAIWVVFGAAYLLAIVPAMHRRLLPGDGRRWAGEDVGAPGAAALLAAALVRAAVPDEASPLAAATAIALAGALATLAAVAAAPAVRAWVLGAVLTRWSARARA
jgi:O-antigen/teichoic acid export membrane protein